MNQGIHTVIIEENVLFREGLAKLLDAKPFRVVAACASVHEMFASRNKSRPELFILGYPSSFAPTAQSIATVRERYPASRIVVISEDCSPTAVCEAFRHGANSYLTKSIALPTLLTALEMVMADLPIAPVETLTVLGQDNRSSHTPLIEIDIADHAAFDTQISASRFQHRSNPDNLSDRELVVSRLLGRGCTNKVIARNLTISDATVKVHVKAIFRKTGARNRTQAAIWAIENGLVHPAEQVAGAG